MKNQQHDQSLKLGQKFKHLAINTPDSPYLAAIMSKYNSINITWQSIGYII